MSKLSELNIGDIFVTEGGSAFDYKIIRKFSAKTTAVDQFGQIKVFDNDLEVYPV